MENLTEKILVEIWGDIEIYFVPLVEYCSIDDLMDFESDKERNKLIYNLDHFNEVLFCAKVFSTYKGIEIASDYLGGCIYDSYEDFYIKYKSEYFSDMVKTVKKESIEYLKDLRYKLNSLDLNIKV